MKSTYIDSIEEDDIDIDKELEQIENEENNKSTKRKRGRRPKNSVADKNEYYVNPEELKTELKHFKRKKIVSEKLGEMLLKIARKFATRGNFSNYTYKDDFISEAVLRMMEQLHKIDLDKPNSNPFSYLTQMCYWKFVAKINYEKKITETKSKITDYYFDEVGVEDNDVQYKDSSITELNFSE